jgi:hypothetical protein
MGKIFALLSIGLLIIAGCGKAADIRELHWGMDRDAVLAAEGDDEFLVENNPDGLVYDARGRRMRLAGIEINRLLLNFEDDEAGVARLSEVTYEITQTTSMQDVNRIAAAISSEFGEPTGRDDKKIPNQWRNPRTMVRMRIDPVDANIRIVFYDAKVAE